MEAKILHLLFKHRWWQRSIWPHYHHLIHLVIQFLKPVVENLDKTFPELHSCNEHYEWQAKEDAPIIPGKRSNARNIRNFSQNWEDYATAQAKQDEYFSPSLTTKYLNFVKRSGSKVKLWINLSQGCEKWRQPVNLVMWQKKKVAGHSELPLQMVTMICIMRRHTYPW